ncbi:MAG: hypothetical protein CXX81_29945 [Methanobacteriota archaeon]|nr:MAG: hypothetical protein CXX81_29945 [Euryarchaeota archaeon]
MRLSIAAILLILFSPLCAMNVGAQGSPNPNINLTCPDAGELIDTFAENASTTIMCELENPTNYAEDVSIEIAADGLNYSAPSGIAVPPLGTEQFNVTISPNSRFVNEVRIVSVTATVTAANGVANPNPVPKTANIELSLGYFSENGCYTYGSSSEEYVRLEVTLNNSSNEPEIIDLMLNYPLAPMHSENFALLAEMGCYDGTIFHRVVDDFMIQGGDIEHANGSGGHAAKWYGTCMAPVIPGCTNNTNDSAYWTVPAEFGGVHSPYVLSMARSSANNSAGSQFFIPDSNTSFLDGSYSVFGGVIAGHSVVDRISEVECATADGKCIDGAVSGSKPVENVTIVKATVLDNIDSDGDGVIDDIDDFPNDANESSDSDDDGVGDNGDAFPEDENESVDSDGDGVGDNADTFPDDENETTDSDGDGVGNNSDAFPDDANETLDSDGDGVGDNADVRPDDSNISTTEDLQQLEDNNEFDEWAIIGAIIFLGICVLISAMSLNRKKDPNSPFDATDSIWDEN